MSDEEDDIVLSALSDEDLVLQMHDDLYDGMKEEIAEGTTILLDRGWGPDRVLNDALVEGMRIVGVDFRDGILFVPEVLLAANAMKAGMAILRPLLAETGAEAVGKVVIGTVKGDIHDIGKNLVAMMLEGAGFEVIDLGINTDVDEFVAALDEHQPDILGMSALLTTTMPYMKVVIDALTEKGLRDDYIVLVGGAPLERGIRSRRWARTPTAVTLPRPPPPPCVIDGSSATAGADAPDLLRRCPPPFWSSPAVRSRAELGCAESGPTAGITSTFSVWTPRCTTGPSAIPARA